MSVDVVYPALSSKKDKAVLQQFVYGNELIEYELKERKSDVDRLLIKVHPDCHVVVLAPKTASEREIQKAVKKRSRWIYSQLKQFKIQHEHVTPRNFRGGESHYYLGKQYLLKVFLNGSQSKIKMLRGKLEITVPSGDQHHQTSHIKMLVNHWYKVRAREVFTRRLGAVLGQTQWVTEKPNIRLLFMRNQWGSCSTNGQLTLNTNLVKAPRECIDYVILHELCHIAEHNHSPRFYRLMSEVMPNWEEVKERLDGMAEVLLNGI